VTEEAQACVAALVARRSGHRGALEHARPALEGAALEASLRAVGPTPGQQASMAGIIAQVAWQ